MHGACFAYWSCCFLVDGVLFPYWPPLLIAAHVCLCFQQPHYVLQRPTYKQALVCILMHVDELLIISNIATAAPGHHLLAWADDMNARSFHLPSSN